ncbi:class I SAM-dependent methyltransferase [Coraliomargarita akajimensis]|uniref:Methyltransferase type 11 n=1 Tax=Coraliomargarita akajimensis (strain DSM 45221 / IAM 15411 / JCM 23193 / KCTC 12865 / 04OKA010-24) TaxID=583355 RepID=D5EQT4_CORAD|nr:class I SAM-dependent methyltransferase [Coraliomargarita akajimensis]ADE53927.1 Methyltransferase type 11 [Coraliomargarita akajimensis DSM 45221]
MERETVLSYFESEAVVDHYADATARLGLWLSEERLFQKLFRRNQSLLELGCGTGRIAFGLHELGYQHVMATDYSKAMIRRARHMAEVLEYPVHLRVEDATALSFDDAAFDGAIFGFNGLMQIPKQAQRLQALREIHRVLKRGGWFVFTSHDRASARYQQFWSEEAGRWQADQQSKDLDDFGDRAEATDLGQHFMHVPSVEEMTEQLEGAGFRIEAHAMRSQLANEPQAVREFSDDCRFWIVEKV